MPSFFRNAAMIILAGFLVAGCAHRRVATPPVSPSFNPQLAVETFEAAWRIIAETHFDTNFNGLDWNRVREDFRPKAAAAEDVEGLRRAIQTMLDQLGDSHMGIIPGEVADTLDVSQARQQKKDRQSAPAKESAPPGKAAGADPASDDDGDFGFDVRWLGEGMVVTRVEAGGPAAEAGIKPGWALQGVDGTQLGGGPARLPPRFERLGIELMKWAVTQELLRGSVGSEGELEFLDAADQPVRLTLKRRLAPGEKVKFGNLPSMQVKFEEEQRTAQDGTSVGIIRFNIFMVPAAPAFDRAVDRFRKADGIVLDMRGNLGGIAGMVMGLSGHFLKERALLGTMKTRTMVMEFHANPRLVNPAGESVEPYGGPVAVLTDRVSASAAEVFAGGLQCTGRARVFGDPSAGQVLLALFDRLPNGDVLLHAFADFITADGTRLEGRGVQPDQSVPLARADLLEGRDPAMDAALAWIAAEQARLRSAGAAGR